MWPGNRNGLRRRERRDTLRDYSQMHKMQAPDGSTRLAYRDPSFVPGNYDAVLLEPMVYYPQPQATDEVSPGTLQDILAYADRSLHSHLGQQVRRWRCGGSWAGNRRANAALHRVARRQGSSTMTEKPVRLPG